MKLTEKQIKQEEKEFKKVSKLIKEKKADKLGEWLKDFAKEEKRSTKKDWL